jgi:hypothetical protein
MYKQATCTSHIMCMHTYHIMCMHTYHIMCMHTYHIMCMHTSHIMCMHTYHIMCMHTYHIMCMHTYHIMCMHTYQNTLRRSSPAVASSAHTCTRSRTSPSSPCWFAYVCMRSHICMHTLAYVPDADPLAHCKENLDVLTTRSFACMYVCVYVCMYVYIYTYISIHAYTHTYMDPSHGVLVPSLVMHLRK